MATAVGAGFDFSGLNKSLKEADKKLGDFVRKCQSAETTVVKNFQNMANNGVSHLIKKMSELDKYLKDLRTSIDSTTKLFAMFGKSKVMSSNNTGNAADAKRIKELEKQVRSLGKRLESLQKKYDKTTAKIDKMNKSTRNVKKAHDDLVQSGSKLKSILTTAFSIASIKGYVQKIIEVRGEFEMQHKAMQTLIGDADKANEIWEKTVALAVKSPYKVKDLVTYTKQLSAYRIETGKLYDKTKMLADISSGLGVDMNRLILAYGQVKAANYLRGTELRQFSEAGINILSELATYFSEIEGRAVSVGDVFERVSKRLVSFDEVDTILQRVTNEGGAFYKMQEKQSQTLRGIVMNLRDSYDLMMNDIGKNNEGVLKGTLSLTKQIVEEWRNIEGVIVTAGTALMTYFSVRALQRITTAFTMNPYAAAIAGVAALAMGIYKVINYQSKMNAAMSEIDSNVSSSLRESISLYHKLADTINDVTESAEERNKAYEKLKNSFKDILPDQELERTYIEQLAGDYKSAEEAMMSYYNAKTVQQKKDKIESMFQSEFEGTDIPELQKAYSTYVKDWLDEKKITKEEYVKLESGLNSAILKAVESAKSGKISASVSSLSKEIENNLRKFAGMKKIPVTVAWTSTYQEQLNDIINTIIKYRDAMSAIDGLPYETYEQQQAAQKKQSLEAEFDAINNYYSKLANLYQKVSSERLDLGSTNEDKNKEKARLDIIEDRAKLIREISKEYPQYVELLKQIDDELEEAASGGVYEFQKALGGIESHLYTSKGGFADIARGLATDTNYAAKTLFENFGESLESEGKKILRGHMQTAIVNAIDYAIDKHDISVESKDFLTKLIPDSSKSTSDVRTQVEGIIKQFEELKSEYEEATKAGATELPFVEWLNKDGEVQTSRSVDAYLSGTAEILARNEELIPVLRTIYQLLGGKEEDSGGGRSIFEKQLSAIKELYKAYKELLKTSNKLQSQSGAWEKVGDAWLDAFGKTPEQMGFDNFYTEEGVTKAFDWLVSTAPDAARRIQAQLAKSEFILEGEVRLRVDEQESILQQIESMFGNYEIGLELDKLDIPQDLAKKIFGIESMDLSELRDSVMRVDTSNFGEDALKEYEKFTKKLEKMEEDARMSRLKTYTKYLREEQDERIKIKLEEIRKLEEVESMNEYDDAQKATIKANIRAEAEKDMMKKSWESFEQSPDFLNLFDDMSKATTHSLEDMKMTLDKLKGSMIAAGLPASDLKDILDKINKVEEELENRKPFQSLKEDWSTLFGSDYKKALDDEKILLEERRILESEKKAIEDSGPDDFQLNILNTEKERLSSMEKGSEEYRQQKELVDGITKSLYPNQERYEEILKLLEKNGVKLDEAQQKTRKWKDSCEDIADHFIAIGDAVNQVGGALGTTLVQMGLMSEETKAIYDSYMSVADNALNLGGNVMKLIANPADPQAWVGAITNTISMIGNIAATGDAVREKQIQAEMKNVGRLEKAYEKLEKAMDDAYNIDQLNVNKRSMEQNIDAQIKSLESAKAKEEANKNVDQDAVDDYSDRINELEEKKAELQRDIVEGLGGTYDYKSVAEDFLDAWLTSFNETGDGLTGLEKSFDEFWKNILKKQVINRGAADIVKNYVSSINKALENDSIIDDQEEKDIAAAEELAKEKLNAYFAYMNEKYNLANLSEGELSGLQAGIQGITEEQAGILEAYWNAVRMDVSAVRFRFEDYANKMLSSDVEVNPMLSQLTTIANHASAISTLLDSVAKNSADDGSLGIRVYMNNA